MNSHDEDPVQILRYVHGDLNDLEMERFSQHLRDCDECRSRVEQEMALSRLFERTAPLYSAPSELHARIAALPAAELHARSSLRTKLRATATWLGDEIQELWHWGTRRWLPVLCTVMIVLVCLGFSPGLLQEFRARDYVEAAVTAHRDTIGGRLPLEIQSAAPEEVTQWAGQRVSFRFQLPASQDVSGGGSRFRLSGARLVEFPRGRGVMVMYHRQDQTVSLLIAPANAAVVAGGDEVQDGRLLFHYRNHAGFNVITWNNHGLAYALVSSVSGPARQSCLVCHGSLPAR
jgi:anti-sigma factor RsiW